MGGAQFLLIMPAASSDFERLAIIEEYLSGPQSKHAIENKYKISHGVLLDWIRKFDLEDKPHSCPMKSSQPPKSDLTLSEREELRQLRKENRVLKSRLKRESLGHEAYKLLVDLAEETYGIEILKNSAAK